MPSVRTESKKNNFAFLDVQGDGGHAQGKKGLDSLQDSFVGAEDHYASATCSEPRNCWRASSVDRRPREKKRRPRRSVTLADAVGRINVFDMVAVLHDEPGRCTLGPFGSSK